MQEERKASLCDPGTRSEGRREGPPLEMIEGAGGELSPCIACCFSFSSPSSLLHSVATAAPLLFSLFSRMNSDP